jgi:hypothetical protein
MVLLHPTRRTAPANSAAAQHPRGRSRRSLLRVLIPMIALLVLAGCGGEGAADQGDALPSTPLRADQDPGLMHVHGLGVNPADDDVYAATHFGVWRLAEGSEAQRVGDAFHDFMGFTVVGADHFVGSGHPLLTEELPPLLGLIESTDGGQTWRSVSLLGQADFHAMRTVDDAVWGWNSSDGALMVSADRQEWERRSTISSLLDFVVDPDDAEHVLAAVAASLEEAGLQRSRDGGRSWEPTEGPPLARMAWEAPDRLWGVGVDGTVWRSTDGGEQWEQAGAADGRPEAFTDAGDRLLVAAGGAISQSADGGATWTDLHREG